jgi:hypothetical protein
MVCPSGERVGTGEHALHGYIAERFREAHLGWLIQHWLQALVGSAVAAALMVSDAPSTLPTYTTISPSSIYIPAGGTATATVSIQIPKGAHVGPYPVGVSATVPDGEFDGPPANAGFYVFGSN